MNAIRHEERPEITDLVVAYDPETLARIDVRKADVLTRLEEHGMRRAILVLHRRLHRPER